MKGTETVGVKSGLNAGAPVVVVAAGNIGEAFVATVERVDKFAE